MFTKFIRKVLRWHCVDSGWGVDFFQADGQPWVEDKEDVKDDDEESVEGEDKDGVEDEENVNGKGMKDED